MERKNEIYLEFHIKLQSGVSSSTLRTFTNTGDILDRYLDSFHRWTASIFRESAIFVEVDMLNKAGHFIALQYLYTPSSFA